MNIKLLKQKNFVFLVLGGFVSVIGSEMQTFILSLYVLNVTGSGTKFASVLAVGVIPRIILGPFAGVFADRWDRKKMIVCLDFLSGIIVGAYAIIYKINGGLSLSYIYVLVIILSLISILFNPAIMAMLPSVIKKEDLPDANSINFGATRIAALIAPIVGAALYGMFGLFIVLIVNAFSFILSSISEMFISIPKNNNSNKKFTVTEFFNDFNDGFRFVLNSKIIFSVILFGILVNFAGTPMFGMINMYILKQVIKISDIQLGILESIMMAAMFISPFISSYLSKRMKIIKILYLDVFTIGIIVAAIAFFCSPLYINLFSTNFVPYVTMIITAVLISILIGINGILLGTIIQQESPVSMIGRIGAVMGTLVIAASPLGQMIFGVLLDKIPIYACVIISSVILIFASFMFKLLTSSESSKHKVVVEDTDSCINHEDLVIISEELATAISEDYKK